MNLYHLSIFLAVLGEESVSLGADRLHISQPAVSKQLKEFEGSLNTKLFDRHAKGVRPTEAGLILAEFARKIFALEAEAELAISELNGLNRGRLTIGASLTIGNYGYLTLSGGPVNLVNSLTIASGGSLTLAGGPLTTGGVINNNGSIVVTANTTLTKPIAGSGSLTIGAASMPPAPTVPATLQLAAGIGTSTVASLTINPGSQLDVTNNAVQMNYGSLAKDPVSTIRADLAAAFAAKYSSAANLSITSSTAAANPGKFTIGYVDNTTTNQLTFALTVPGDTDLSGTTDFNDLTTVAQFFGQSIAKGNNVNWQTGDVNYDGNVDFNDLTLVAQYFGDSLSKAEAASLPASFVAQYDLARAETDGRASAVRGTTSVPEPQSLCLSALLAVTLLARRRERSPSGDLGWIRDPADCARTTGDASPPNSTSISCDLKILPGIVLTSHARFARFRSVNFMPIR